MIVQNVSARTAKCNLSFTVPRDAVNRAAEAITPIAKEQISIEPAMAKLSVIGVGMRIHTGIAPPMFGALADRSMNINLINSSKDPHQRRHRRRQGQGRTGLPEEGLRSEPRILRPTEEQISR